MNPNAQLFQQTPQSQRPSMQVPVSTNAMQPRNSNNSTKSSSQTANNQSTIPNPQTTITTSSINVSANYNNLVTEVLNSEINLSTYKNSLYLQKSEKFDLDSLLAVIEEAIQVTVKAYNVEQIISILSSGSKFSTDTDKILPWIATNEVKYKNSKNTPKVKLELATSNSFIIALKKDMANVKGYEQLPRKEPIWSLIFATTTMQKWGLELFGVALIGESKYRRMIYSSFAQFQVPLAQWLNVAKTGWDAIFIMFDYFFASGGQLEATVNGYYNAKGISPVVNYKEANIADTIYNLQNVPTLRSVLAYGNALDWRRELKNTVFSNSKTAPDAKQAAYLMLYQMIANWYKEASFVFSGTAFEIIVTDDIRDPQSALSVKYYELMTKMKRGYRAITGAVTGNIRKNGAKGVRISTNANVSPTDFVHVNIYKT